MFNQKRIVCQNNIEIIFHEIYPFSNVQMKLTLIMNCILYFYLKNTYTYTLYIFTFIAERFSQ